MVAELRRSAPAAAALPLIAGALLASCGREEKVAANLAAAPVAKAPETAIARAERLVRARVDGDIGFAGVRQFASGGADVVCGTYIPANGSPLRFIAVGAEDVFVEGDYSGDIGQAVAETCRNN